MLPVAVGPLVGAILQELIDQIAVGAVHLDAVEPGGQRIARALRILRDDRGYLAVSSARGVGIGSKPFAVKA